MVQSLAPAKTTQTGDGLIMMRVCTGDDCVLAQVECKVNVYEDGSWHVAYWQPLNPLNNAQAFGEQASESQALQAMLAAIRSLASVQP